MAIAIMTAHHSRIIENGQKGGMWVELVAETKRHSGHSSGSPPVTQVAMPLIMQNFKAWYNLSIYQALRPPHICHEGQNELYRPKYVFKPGCKHVFFCCKFIV